MDDVDDDLAQDEIESIDLTQEDDIDAEDEPAEGLDWSGERSEADDSGIVMDQN